jgi:hypothetical protein
MALDEQLENLRSGPVTSAREADAAAEAARLLAELMRLRDRAQRLFAEVGSATDPHTTRAVGESLAGLSLHAAAERVLRQAGVPLHAREMGVRIKAGGWRHPRSPNPRRDQIVFQLAARLPRHPETFQRVGPNTFALVEWEGDQERSRRRRPRTGLFSGPGKPIGREIGESEEPFEKGAAWRSS